MTSAVGMCKAADAKMLRARCHVNGLGRDCRILNLSPRRIFVESFVPAITGSPITVSFHLPNGHLVNAGGIVSRHEFTVGFDVDLTQLSDNDHAQLSDFLG